MFKLICKVILIGFLLGILASAVTMFFGVAVYYAVSLIDVFFFTDFLSYVAWFALTIGVLSTLGWYISIIVFARAAIKSILDRVMVNDK